MVVVGAARLSILLVLGSEPDERWFAVPSRLTSQHANRRSELTVTVDRTHAVATAHAS
jgi:hypothetical protein